MASTNRKTAAEERGKALKGRGSDFVDALKVERAGYVTRGLPDRVKQVDDQIKLYSGAEPAKAPAASTAAAKKAAADAAAKKAAEAATAEAEAEAAANAAPDEGADAADTDTGKES